MSSLFWFNPHDINLSSLYITTNTGQQTCGLNKKQR